MMSIMVKHVGLHFRQSTSRLLSRAPRGTDLPSNSLSRRSPSLIARSNRQSLLSRDETLLAGVQRISSCRIRGIEKDTREWRKRKRRSGERRRRKRSRRSGSIGNSNVTASRRVFGEKKGSSKEET